MSATRTALHQLAATAELLAAKPQLPTVSECETQAQSLKRHVGATRPPDREVLEVLREELHKACVGGEVNLLSSRTLRRAPMVFWDLEPQAAGFPGLLEVVLQGAAERPRWLREIIEAWLRDFQLDRARLPEVGHAMGNLLPHMDDPRLTPWHRAHQRFALFEASKGPQRVGSALLIGPDSVDSVLAQTGMDDPLRAEGRFFRAALHELLKALPTALRSKASNEAWRRAAMLLEVQRAGRDRRGHETMVAGLRLPDMAGEVISACLDPWLSPPPPTAAPREEIKAFLLRVIGDPRLRPDRWSTAPEQCTRLMRGWLASATLETFFALISETNDDPQWQYRRAFWRACLRKMPPHEPAEVWVVLGPGMANRAKAVREMASAFGRMEAGGSSGEQAVLLLRLGNIVMSEWSNVGPIRAWEIDDRRCPQLYRDRYEGSDLRARGLDFPDHPIYGNGGAVDGKGLWHRNPQRGLWQGCAAAFLLDRLQLRLMPDDYRVS